MRRRVWCALMLDALRFEYLTSFGFEATLGSVRVRKDAVGSPNEHPMEGMHV